MALRLAGGAPPAALAAACGGALHSQLGSTALSALQQRSLHSQQRHRCNRSLALVLEARDGKKRRKPQPRGGAPGGGGSGGSSGSDDERPRPPPRRVTPDSLIPVRVQQRFAKMNKEYERQQREGFRQKAPQAQAYRRSLDSEEYRREQEERERMIEEARKRKSDMLTLQQMFRTTISAPGEQPTGVTLVDGYNLLHKWRLKPGPVRDLMLEAERRGTEGALQAAREHLLHELDAYSHAEAMFVHVVFDAMGRGLSSQQNTLGMIVNFTGSEEADSFILRQAREYIGKGVQKVCIVSDDVEVATLGLDAAPSGPQSQAVCACSCSALIKLISTSHRSLHDRLELENARNQRVAGSTLGHAAKVAARRGGGSGGGAGGGGGMGGLLALRQQLAEKEIEEYSAQRQQQQQERQRRNQARQQ